MLQYHWQRGFVVLFGVLLVGGALRLVLAPPTSSTPLVTLVVISMAAVLLTPILPNVQELDFSSKGFKAKIDRLKSEVDEARQKVDRQEQTVQAQGEQIQRQQDMINELVKFSMSASIFRHLCGLTLLKEYKYHDGESFRREMYFLRDNGFIKPKGDGFIDFNQGIDNRNLVDLAEPTPVGSNLVRIRSAEIPPEMRNDLGNLRVRIEDL